MTEPAVAVLAPSPLLTITIEDGPRVPEVHLHPGGQGFWVARLAASLGAKVSICASFGGESGRVLRGLLEEYAMTVWEVPARGENGVYVHDRRGGERLPIVETEASPLSRHELDELYNAALVTGLECDVTVLGGPTPPDLLPVDVYRRLASDLRASGKRVIVDLHGPVLDAALSAGVELAKLSIDELIGDGRARSESLEDLLAAMADVAGQGAAHVVVTRADRSPMAFVDRTPYEVSTPRVEAREPTGGGDAFTAAIAVAVARGDGMEEALRLAAAAKGLNATRHGLGSGNRRAIEHLARQIDVRPLGRR